MHRVLLVLAVSVVSADGGDQSAETHPLSAKRRYELNEQLDETVRSLTTAIEKHPQHVRLYSRRGDAYFFRGRFEQALADYEKMVELDPDLAARHWRRGLARFYVGRYDGAARQFEMYYKTDAVDRENGIWRFFAQVKEAGLEKAREELLPYHKPDREPLPDVYRMLAGEMTPEEVLEAVRGDDLSEAQRQKREFYGYLYVGLNYAVTGRSEKALPHLREAIRNEWAPQAGYGPRYMWHVGRLHYGLLRKDRNRQPQ